MSIDEKNKRVESYQFQIDFIDPETMQLVDNNHLVTIWVDKDGTLKACRFLYDNFTKPLIVKLRNTK